MSNFGPERSQKCNVQDYSRGMSRILIVTGDGGESYEALYAVHRFEEEGWMPVVAAHRGAGSIW